MRTVIEDTNCLNLFLNSGTNSTDLYKFLQILNEKYLTHVTFVYRISKSSSLIHLANIHSKQNNSDKENAKVRILHYKISYHC